MCSGDGIKQRFLHSLKCGTGEAYLITRDNPQIDFSRSIIKGVLKNYAYDGQSEGSRAQYLYDIIMLSEKKETVFQALLKGIEIEREDTWSLTHMVDLARIFAQNGSEEAKAAIKKRFLKDPIEGSDWIGCEEIMLLEGIDGLFYVAEAYGKQTDRDPEEWQDDDAIRLFQEMYPEMDAFAELEKASKKNKYIQIYLNALPKPEIQRAPLKKQAHDMLDIVDRVLYAKPFFTIRQKSELTKSEVRQIAIRLVDENNNKNIEKLLAIFTMHPFPLEPAFILKLTQGKRQTTIKIRDYAVDALRFLSSPSIRAFALSRILKSRRPEPFIAILMSNYGDGDHKLLAEIAEKFKSEHLIESLASSYVDIYKNNKTVKCKEPLEILYQKMNCGIHRHDIIKILIENNVLSEKIRQEIQYDSYLETRELYALHV